MAYNLLGQQGTYGTRNPDPNLSDAEATYLYDKAPGEGDNKGVRYTSYVEKLLTKKHIMKKQKKLMLKKLKQQSHLIKIYLVHHLLKKNL